MRRETKLRIYLHVTWRMPPWMPWSDSPRAGAAPSRGGAGHQARAGSGLQTEITLSRWLTDSIFTQSTVLSLRHRRPGYNTHSDTARGKFHWFPPPRDYVWTDCVAVVLSAVRRHSSCQCDRYRLPSVQTLAPGHSWAKCQPQQDTAIT